MIAALNVGMFVLCACVVLVCGRSIVTDSPLKTVVDEKHLLVNRASIFFSSCEARDPMLSGKYSLDHLQEDRKGIVWHTRPIRTGGENCFWNNGNNNIMDAGVCIRKPGKNAIACLPSFMIIGAMKCGTSELQNWLALHPQLQRWSDAKMTSEPHFFDFATKESIPRTILNEYLFKGFVLSTAQDVITRYTFEKTPYYLTMNESSIELVRSVLTHAKLIALVREPVSRVYSHFQHRCRAGDVWEVADKPHIDEEVRGVVLVNAISCQGRVCPRKKMTVNLLSKYGVTMSDLWNVPSPCSAESFDKLVNAGLRQLPTGKKYSPEEVVDKLKDFMRNSISRSMYATQLRLWRSKFGNKNLLVLPSEHFFTNLTLGIDRAQQFLGLNYMDYAPLTRKSIKGSLTIIDQTVQTKSEASSYERILTKTKIRLSEIFAVANEQMVEFVGQDVIDKWTLSYTS